MKKRISRISSVTFALTYKARLISQCKNAKRKVLNCRRNMYFNRKCILRYQTPNYDDYKNK